MFVVQHLWYFLSLASQPCPLCMCCRLVEPKVVTHHFYTYRYFSNGLVVLDIPFYRYTPPYVSVIVYFADFLYVTFVWGDWIACTFRFLISWPLCLFFIAWCNPLAHLKIIWKSPITVFSLVSNPPPASLFCFGAFRLLVCMTMSLVGGAFIFLLPCSYYFQTDSERYSHTSSHSKNGVYIKT